MKKILLFIVIFCCQLPIAFAQTTHLEDTLQWQEEDTSYTEATDAGKEEAQEFKKPTMRVVSPDSLNKIRQQPAFAYMQHIDSFYKAKDPLVINEAAETPAEEEAPGLFDNIGFRTFYWGAALLVVLWILWQLFIGRNALFSRNRSIKNEAVVESDTPLSDDHLGKLLDSAIQAKDYRLAVRYLYLQTLNALGEKQLLLLAPQKTNYQYVQELRETALQDAFSTLTMQYEYAWFGGFPLSNQQFEEIYDANKKMKAAI